MEMCSEHPSNQVSAYCRQCGQAVCVVCSSIEHDGHSIVGLTELMVELQGDLNRHIQTNSRTMSQLDVLIAGVAPQVAELHRYIDTELDTLVDALDAQRKSLRAEVDARTNEARRQLSEELSLVESELDTLASGASVLDALSKRRGMVEGYLGGLICEKISFDEFMQHVDAPLHEPPRMLEMLGLQLPTQSLQEMCDLISWTNITVEPTRQVFPISSAEALH